MYSNSRKKGLLIQLGFFVFFKRELSKLVLVLMLKTRVAFVLKWVYQIADAVIHPILNQQFSVIPILLTLLNNHIYACYSVMSCLESITNNLNQNDYGFKIQFDSNVQNIFSKKINLLFFAKSLTIISNLAQ